MATLSRFFYVRLIRVIIPLIAFFTCYKVVTAQDFRELNYLYSVLKPSHADKPQVNGFADERVKEGINRGLQAVNSGDTAVYINWRFLDTDEENTAFNLYRITSDKRILLNESLIETTTDYLDVAIPDDNYKYQLVPVVNGQEQTDLVSETSILNINYYSIPLQDDYQLQSVATADLNGDGKYDYIVKHPRGNIDPGNGGNPDKKTFKIEAYLHDGTFLWRKDLGLGIEPGVWYSPYVVFDFDGDGKAEVALKTGPEDAQMDKRGRVFSGPEWLSVLDGMTGKEKARVDWTPRDPRYGDYNRNSRNQIGMAYLDGKTPFILVARGTYRLMVVEAWQYHKGKLSKKWRWDSDEENPIIRHQGAHSMHTLDIDGDGRDEIMLGSVVLDDTGVALWSTGYGHPDKCFITDIDPNRPGLEAFFVLEDPHEDYNGVVVVDALTGENIWNIGHYTRHVGQGMVADIDPKEPGLECFAAEDAKAGLRDRYMLSASGKYLARNKGVPRNQVDWMFWDSDKLRETIQRKHRWRGGFSIVKYEGDTLTRGFDGNILMIADLIGDWREEVVTSVRGEMRIYTTTIPATDRRVSLMQDPLYRSDIAHRSMGYAQSPMTTYYLGE